MNGVWAPNDISHIWTRFNSRWMLTGLFSGLGAGLVMFCLAAYFSTFLSREVTFPAKLIGAVLENGAMRADSFGFGPSVGLLIHFGLAAFFGLVFAQFVAEWSRKRVLVLLGTLGGLAIWLFWSAMFMPSFNEPMSALLPKAVSLMLHFTFGLAFGLLLVWLRPLLCRNA